MNRQEFFLKIRKAVERDRSLEKLIISKDFLNYPEYRGWKEDFDKYKEIYQSKEQWEQFAKFALTDPKERAYMYERVIQLLIKYLLSYEKYFQIRSESGTVPFFNRISSLNRLLILNKEYFQIYSNIIKKIHFDYPKKEYTGKYIKGIIDWSATLKRTSSSFPVDFKTKTLYKKFNVPENILLLLCAYWLGNEASRLLRLDFLEPLDKNEIYILNLVIQRSKRIITSFPFKEVLESVKEFIKLDINDKGIKNLEILSQRRLKEGIIKNNEYFKLLNWIDKYKQLNIRMFSSNNTNFPIDNISSLDTLYEVWIFLEILDYINTSISTVITNFSKDEIKNKYFEFRFQENKERSIEFHYEKEFTYKDKEIWIGDKITPDFTIISESKIVAVFDAKNYNKDIKGVKKQATDVILAYMSYLDTNCGGVLSPKFGYEEYHHRRKYTDTIYYTDLKLAYYKLEPKDEELVIKKNYEMIEDLLNDIKSRLIEKNN